MYTLHSSYRLGISSFIPLSHSDHATGCIHEMTSGNMNQFSGSVPRASLDPEHLTISQDRAASFENGNMNQLQTIVFNQYSVALLANPQVRNHMAPKDLHPQMNR